MKLRCLLTFIFESRSLGFKKSSICWTVQCSQQEDIVCVCVCVCVCVWVCVCSLKKKNQRRTRWQRPSGQQWLLTYLNDEKNSINSVMFLRWNGDQGEMLIRGRFQLNKRKHFQTMCITTEQAAQWVRELFYLGRGRLEQCKKTELGSNLSFALS